MTPVMAVIVIVEITCQEGWSSRLGEGVALLTRGDRGDGGEAGGGSRGTGDRGVRGEGGSLMTSPLIISRRGLWDNSAVNAT